MTRTLERCNGRFVRSSLYGIGTNDLPYSVEKKINGKRVRDPIYVKWINMLYRTTEMYQERNPWYKGVTVCDEWLSALKFKEWADAQQEDISTHHLDKDLLCFGNKQYSPDTCLLVTPEVNQLFSFRTEGEYPVGVFKITKRLNYSKPFATEIRRLGHTPYKKRLGYFATPEEAAETYNTAKKEHILEVQSKQTNPKVINALQWWHDNWETIAKDLKS